MSDELDRALSDGLTSLSADVDDADEVLASLQPRMRRARRRYRLARASAALVSALIIGTIGVALASSSARHHHVAVRVTPPTSARRSVPTTTSTSVTHRTPAATTPGTARRGVPGPATPSTPSRWPSTDSTTVTTAPSELHTYDATGGSITVRFRAGALSLVSDTPATGYTAEIHDEGPERVEVRFSTDHHESHIRVDVDHGRLAPEIEDS